MGGGKGTKTLQVQRARRVRELASEIAYKVDDSASWGCRCVQCASSWARQRSREQRAAYM